MVSRRLYASVCMDSKKPKHLIISQLSTSYHNPLPSPSMKKRTMWCPGKALTWGLQVIGIMMAFKATHPDEIAWGVCTGAERSPRWRAWAASTSRALRKENPAEEVMGEGKRRRISNNGLKKKSHFITGSSWIHRSLLPQTLIPPVTIDSSVSASHTLHRAYM